MTEEVKRRCMNCGLQRDEDQFKICFHCKEQITNFKGSGLCFHCDSNDFYKKDGTNEYECNRCYYLSDNTKELNKKFVNKLDKLHTCDTCKEQIKRSRLWKYYICEACYEESENENESDEESEYECDYKNDYKLKKNNENKKGYLPNLLSKLYNKKQDEETLKESYENYRKNMSNKFNKDNKTFIFHINNNNMYF